MRPASFTRFASLPGLPEGEPPLDGERLRDRPEGSDVLMLHPAIAAAAGFDKADLNPLRCLSETSEHCSVGEAVAST